MISLEYKAPFTHFFVCLRIYVLPCIPGWPVTHYVGQADLELGGDPFLLLGFALPVLRLKACVSSQLILSFKN